MQTIYSELVTAFFLIGIFFDIQVWIFQKLKFFIFAACLSEIIIFSEIKCRLLIEKF